MNYKYLSGILLIITLGSCAKEPVIQEQPVSLLEPRASGNGSTGTCIPITSFNVKDIGRNTMEIGYSSHVCEFASPYIETETYDLTTGALIDYQNNLPLNFKFNVSVPHPGNYKVSLRFSVYFGDVPFYLRDSKSVTVLMH